MTKRLPFDQRFRSRIERRGPDECWPWRGGRDVKGYGLISRDGRSVRATWIALEFDGRPRPSVAHEACHTCDNPPCINPAHLWWGTRSENIFDASRKGRHHQRAKTECHRGHPFSGENLRILANGRRECKACRNDIRRRWRERCRELGYAC
jgi:hypothetical protein